ncbi:MAG: DUF885 family protein [Parvularculaceae bacterium]
MTLRALLAASFLLVLAGCDDGGGGQTTAPAGPAPETEPAAVEESAADPNAAFDAAVEELSRAYFEELPEIATYYGAPPDIAPGADGRLTDRSTAADAARRARMEKLLQAVKDVEPDALDEDRRLTRNVVIALLDGALAPARTVDYGVVLGDYGVWFLPYAVTQLSGPHVAVPNLMEAQQAVADEVDAENYLARLSSYGAIVDGVIEKLGHDADLGAVPPDFVLEKARAVIAASLSAPPLENVLYTSFEKKLADAGIADVESYRARAAVAIEDSVYPANRRLHDYLDGLKANAPHDAGIWRLPNGPALYKAMIRQMTDTDLTAEGIHQIGLDEVARITGEMDAILRAEGYEEGSVGERMDALSKEERFFYPNTEEGKAAIMTAIQDQLDGVNAVLPQWFGRLPKYGLEVRAVPVFSQESAPGGYYDSPALDGSRPGIYWINLRDTAIWPKFAVPTLTYHEAIPGHHMQTAISLEKDAPLLLSALYSNAYGEGWALYSENLASEMGLYEGDPYGDLGRLQDELHRAIRLVVDTGMHAMKWSREQAIDYMVETEGVHPSEAEVEIERYAVWPGQALGYKIGMLKIQELRRRAETELGDGFDIRDFHDRVLRDGAVPLSVLEANINAWIDSEKDGG